MIHYISWPWGAKEYQEAIYWGHVTFTTAVVIIKR